MKNNGVLFIMIRVTIVLFTVLFLISCQSKKTNYDDLLDYQSKTSIVLPKAIGSLIELNDTTNYHFFYLEKQSNDSIVFWVNGKQTSLNDFSVEYQDDLLDDISILFIDKNIKMKEVDKLFDVLSGYLLNRIIIAISNDNNKTKQLFGIKMHLPPTERLLFENDSAIPPFIIEFSLEDYPTNFNTYIYRNDSILLNDEFIEKDNLVRQYRAELLRDRKRSLYFYIDSNSFFQSYVDMFDLFFTVAYYVRERYSKQEHNMSIEDLDDVKYRELVRKFPIRVKRITDEEFVNMEIIIFIEDEIMYF